MYHETAGNSSIVAVLSGECPLIAAFDESNESRGVLPNNLLQVEQNHKSISPNIAFSFIELY